MSNVPEANVITLPYDIYTNISNISDCSNIQLALPIVFANGYRDNIEIYSIGYSYKIVDKCIILAALNNCIICGLGYKYTDLIFFYIGLYINVIFVFGCAPKNIRENANLISIKLFQKKICFLIFLSSYIIKTTWVGVKIIYRSKDIYLIILGVLTFLHDIELMYLMNESLVSSF